MGAVRLAQACPNVSKIPKNYPRQSGGLSGVGNSLE